MRLPSQSNYSANFGKPRLLAGTLVATLPGNKLGIYSSSKL